MTVALQRPWTLEQFLRWAGAQDGRYEFDGERPVAMTGGNARHSRVTGNIHAALRARLRGAPCQAYGPDLGVRTIGAKVRYPDALVTCAPFPDTAQIAPDVRVIFEVVSPSSGQTDRIEKVREYAAVPSMRRYIIVETRSAGLLLLHRTGADEPWTATALTADDTLALPEIGIEIPVSEVYEGVDFETAATDWTVEAGD
jgi:Uma2 family endonuclease